MNVNKETSALIVLPGRDQCRPELYYIIPLETGSCLSSTPLTPWAPERLRERKGGGGGVERERGGASGGGEKERKRAMGIEKDRGEREGERGEMGIEKDRGERGRERGDGDRER